MSALADLIRNRATELGLSMNKIAELADVSPTALSKFQLGKTEDFKLSTLLGLSRALSVSPRRLLEAHGITVDMPSTDNPQRRAETILGAVPELAIYLGPILELEPDDRDAVLSFVEDLRRRRQQGKRP